jgi:hypothetical protein
MARATFGGTAADFLMTVGPGGVIRASSGTLTLWTAQTGGTQVTDLLLNGNAASTIPVGSNGAVPIFQGPDEVSELWADAGNGRVRIDAGGSLQVLVDEAVEQATQDHIPGVELGYASRTTTYTTTSTVTGASAVTIPGVTATVVGQGRPVDVRFYAPSVYHSVANTFVGASVNTGNPVGVNANLMVQQSTAVNNGPGILIEYRTSILTLGVSYTFQVSVWGAAAGTSTFVGATYCPIELAITAR